MFFYNSLWIFFFFFFIFIVAFRSLSEDLAQSKWFWWTLRTLCLVRRAKFETFSCLQTNHFRSELVLCEHQTSFPPVDYLQGVFEKEADIANQNRSVSLIISVTMCYLTTWTVNLQNVPDELSWMLAKSATHRLQYSSSQLEASGLERNEGHSGWMNIFGTRKIKGDPPGRFPVAS